MPKESYYHSPVEKKILSGARKAKKKAGGLLSALSKSAKKMIGTPGEGVRTKGLARKKLHGFQFGKKSR
jgi:hypothetical protein